MKAKIIITLFIFLAPVAVFSANNKTNDVFQAQVSEILQEKTVPSSKGEEVLQQNIQLMGLSGERKGKEYFYQGIDNFQVLKNKKYKIGDKVLLLESLDGQNNMQYYIVDYVRINSIYWLFAIFVLVLILVGGVKGLRSIFSLIFTFIIILKYIIPKILLGANPLLVTIIGSLFILLAIIYLTEGFKPISHLAIVSILISLLFSVFLSWFFVLSGRLSGLFNEEVASLATIGDFTINFKGLLLAGIIIGLLGVLDDVVIAQISTVEQIYLTDPRQSRKKLFKNSYKVGVSHISSMTNTLFLAYAGVSLPLLVLIGSGESAFSSAFDILNNEQVATEIVRTLAGSVGLILAVPISTFMAVAWYKKKLG